MRRVLQIVDSMDMGGIQSFLMNVYRHIDRTIIQFDFMVFRSHKQVFEDEILSMGGHIYKLPGRREGIFKNKKAIKSFFKTHSEYKIIHFNASSLSDIGVLKEAKKNKVPIRIIHSHSTKAPGSKLHSYIHRLNRKKIDKYATNYLACGELAAKWFYDGTSVLSKVQIVNNGIDCDSYQFSEERRTNKRKELNLNNELVVIQVGRFAEVKNQMFTIHVFDELVRQRKKSTPILIFAGEGPLIDEVKKTTQELHLENRVRFLGNRSDVPELLQAADLMLMPSLYEGFPVTAIEGQAAGLPCFLSDTITSTAAIKKNVHMLSLKLTYKQWVEVILSDQRRIADNTILTELGYDIKTTVHQLITLYQTV